LWRISGKEAQLLRLSRGKKKESNALSTGHYKERTTPPQAKRKPATEGRWVLLPRKEKTPRTFSKKKKDTRSFPCRRGGILVQREKEKGEGGKLVPGESS